MQDMLQSEMLNYDLDHPCLNFEKVCRFCLSEEDCVSLFTGTDLNDILLDIIDVLLLKVDENDGLPNNVCRRCHQTMANYAKFESTAFEIYRVLERALTLDHGTNDDEEEKDAVAMAATVEHEQIGAINGDDIDRGPAVESLTKFTEEEPSDNGVPNNSEQIISAEEQDSESDLLVNQTRQKKPCPVCGKLVSQVSKHMPVHTATKSYRCEYCQKKFAYPASLRKHLNIHLNIRKYVCEYCEESFCDRSSLRYHVAKHRGVKEYQCALCVRVFYTSSCLKQHQALRHRERTFQCRECGKRFFMKHHLMDHIRTHNDGRPFECGECGKTYRLERYYKRHALTHKDKNLHKAKSGIDITSGT